MSVRVYVGKNRVDGKCINGYQGKIKARIIKGSDGRGEENIFGDMHTRKNHQRLRETRSQDINIFMCEKIFVLDSSCVTLAKRVQGADIT